MTLQERDAKARVIARELGVDTAQSAATIRRHLNNVHGLYWFPSLRVWKKLGDGEHEHTGSPRPGNGGQRQSAGRPPSDKAPESYRFSQTARQSIEVLFVATKSLRGPRFSRTLMIEELIEREWRECQGV